MKMTYKKIYFKDNTRFILFKKEGVKSYFINETDLENVLRFSSLDLAKKYLIEKGVKLCEKK